MDSDFQQQNYQHHFQDQQGHQKQHQMNNLTRFLSAPSSYFASFLDVIDNTIPSNEPSNGGASHHQQQQRTDFVNARPLSPETENIFARFMSSMAEDDDNNNNSSQTLCSISENSTVDQSQYVVKQEIETLHQHQQQPKMIYQSQFKPPLARQHVVNSTTVMDQNSFRGGGNSSFNNNYGRSSGLIRHNSSPAGFFSNIMNTDNGFGVIKGMGNFGGDRGDCQIHFSSANSTTTSVLMDQSSDIGAKRFKSVENTGNNNSNSDSKSNYMTGYPSMTSWDDSDLSENFSSLERAGGGDDARKTFSELNASENQGHDGRNRPRLLSHHLSLPKTSAKLSAMEKLLQFQDTVPCRIRAKRGCATHPRSIAERVRRTKISERMRKLQDLVPNMDKQTNTADMLDLAVEYIKDLQNQVKNLTNNRAKCTCC